MVNKRVQTLLEQLRAQGIRDEHVLEALALVPREKFVDEAFEHKAWENVALPIGPRVPDQNRQGFLRSVPPAEKLPV